MSLLDKMKGAAASRVPLWLDDARYSGTLLAGGAVPWSDVTAYCAWRRKAQSLLRSDVLVFPLDGALVAWVISHPALAAALKARRRPLYPLKTLLADAELRSHLTDLIRALRSASADLPLALSCRLPRALAGDVFQLALGESCQIEDDDADGASMYLADLLRAFGELGVDGLLLGQPSDVQHAPVDAFCQPIINLAAHYRWALGRFQPPQHPLDGLSFIVSSEAANASLPTGIVIDTPFWEGGRAAGAPTGGFRYAEIPTTLAPDAVMSRLDVLRQ
jgi:hypothetical protein